MSGSAIMDSHPTRRDDDDDASKDLMTFCLQFIHYACWKSGRLFTCGSEIEIPHYDHIARYFGVSYKTLDVDLMGYKTSHVAVHRFASLPETYTGDIIRIYSDDVHAGYARLIREKDNTEVLHSDLLNSDILLVGLHAVKGSEKRHGPALMIDTELSTLRNNYTQNNADAGKLVYDKSNTSLHDVVPAVHSPYWPVEATEWITRRRSQGFPSKTVIKKAVRYGCDFVQVSHNRLRNDGEWRLSFSRAELLVVKSWSMSQMIAYCTLWGLNKRIASRNLSSYYFKTLMFWACEEKPTKFWSTDSLALSVCELLIEMITWVKSKFCLNYFIPANNMLDHLTGTDLSCEIDALWRTFQSLQLITEAVEACRIEQSLSTNTMYIIECPSWLKRARVINQCADNDDDNYTCSFSRVLAPDYQNAFYVEFSDIFRGLYFQQKSVSSRRASIKHTYFLKSECHLLLAANLCKSEELDVMYNCSLSHFLSVTECFMPVEIDKHMKAYNDKIESNAMHISMVVKWNTSNDHNEHKCLLYSRTVEKHENNILSKKIIHGKNVRIAAHRVFKMETSPVSNAQIYLEWPEMSPTVNTSWFIAKAYLANLYYKIPHDFTRAITICDEIIGVYEQSSMNKIFAEKTFSVVLSTQWTSVYDRIIQELLGFYSLSSYVFDASHRSVYLGVCPVLFAYYLKVRAVIYRHIRDSVLSDVTMMKYIDDYDKHIRECKGDEQINTGALSLTKSLEVLYRSTPSSSYII